MIIIHFANEIHALAVSVSALISVCQAEKPLSCDLGTNLRKHDDK